MFETGNIIRHRRTKNIAFQIVTITEDPATQNFLLTGIWLNDGTMTKVIIQRRYLSDWFKCESTKALN